MGRKRLIASPEEMERFGEEIGKSLPEKATLFLYGDLGAGKTSFVKGLKKAFAIEDPIISPTFVYLNTYEGSRHLFHFDLYRLTSGQEFFDLGFDEYLEKAGIVAIEWAERLKGFNVHPDVEIFFFHKSLEEREVCVKLDPTQR